ncbi:MAG: hypothetical protein GYA24_11250 [Candidatus Lokiarchaeota archaeon]|nr:hypothetical protein [Candidatus Lokiarchaeota archaeon]
MSHVKWTIQLSRRVTSMFSSFHSSFYSMFSFFYRGDIFAERSMAIMG